MKPTQEPVHIPTAGSATPISADRRPADGMPKVIFSTPLTYPRALALPQNFCFIANESDLSWECAKKFPLWISDRFARVWLIFKIIRQRRADWIITGRYGEYFAFLQGMFPVFKRPLILLDVEWHGTIRNKLVSSVKKWMHRVMARGALKIGVYCEAEAANYSAYYGISRNKFFWMPYCSELRKEDFSGGEDNFIFTGGTQQRDYETLFHAVKDLPITVKIVAPKNALEKRFIAQNMQVLGRLNAFECYSLMARAKLVVVSVMPDIRRCPGVITYVSGMKLGKAVIVNELNGSRSYIRDGITGVLIPPKDPAALRGAIERLLANNEMRTKLSRNAYRFATEHFSVDRLIDSLVNLPRMNGWVVQ